MDGASAHDVVMDGGMGDVWLWWLEHGLDGIGGGILAVLGVAVTLWWDRKARRQEHERADLSAARAAVTEAARTMGRLRLSTGSDAEWTDKVVQWHTELFGAASDASLAVLALEPRLFVELTEFLEAVIRVADDNLGRPDRKQLVLLVNQIEVRLRAWALDPATYRELDRLKFPPETRTEVDEGLLPGEPE